MGCLNCGTRRKRDDIINKTYDVYLRCCCNNTLIRVGLCPMCYENKESLDLSELKQKLFDSEQSFEKNKKVPKNKSKLKVFKTANFDKLVGYSDFWDALILKHPEGITCPSQYLEVCDDC